ncbi:MIER2 protein, partial [Upupa epops]|nr:MIER2 protein [Upupa epops]
SKASVGRQSPRVVPYQARSLCPGEPGLQSAAVVSMGSADHRLNLAEILSQNYGVREEREEEDDDAEAKQKSLEELEKTFSSPQSSEMPFEELLALYGYEASDPVSEQDSESNDITPNLPDMTLDKEQIAKDLLSGEEEEETQSSADDLTPSVTSHDASDLFPNRPGSNNFLADEDKEPCSSPCASSMAEDSEEDSIPSNDCKKEIMVGPQYQATVPILRINRLGEKAYENEDQLLWDPNILPEREVEEFLYRAVKRRWDELTSSSLPEGEAVKDNEQALYELVKCNFNAEEALRRLRFNVKVIRDELCAWSEEECRNFEHGFRVHGKNFHLIQANKVRTRSVGECVEYYYIHVRGLFSPYSSNALPRGEPWALLPELSGDFTDNDLDGAEVESASRSRSSPPVPSATSSLDSHFGQDQIAIESAGNPPPSSAAGLAPSLPRAGLGPCAPGLYALPAAAPGLAEKREPLRSSGETIPADFTLPAGVAEALPLLAGPVALDRDPEAVVAPAQVSLSVTEFGLLGIGDVNSFLT